MLGGVPYNPHRGMGWHNISVNPNKIGHPVVQWYLFYKISMHMGRFV